MAEPLSPVPTAGGPPARARAIGIATGSGLERPGLWLALSAVVSVAVWQLPNGAYWLYPFTILATWFHEMGHGLTALVLGGRFETLELFADGSGVAHWTGSGFGRFAQAAVAAGGPFGPPLAGCAFILAGRSRLGARIGLGVLAVALLLSLVLVVRTLFGFVAIAVWGTVIVAVALSSVAWLRALAIQLLGVQACLATFASADYLFRSAVIIDGRAMASDTGAIANALWLPHWLWAVGIVAWSALLLGGSLFVAYRGVLGTPQTPRTPAALPS